MEVGQKKLQSAKVKISYSTGCTYMTKYQNYLIGFPPWGSFSHLSQFNKMFHASCQSWPDILKLFSFKTKTHWVDGGIFKEQTKTNGRKCLQTVSIWGQSLMGT